MKKLKYLLFLFIILAFPTVFADTSFDMTNKITSPVNFSECGVGSYTGVELNGATNCWKTNTRYQGSLNRIYFNLPAPTGNAFEGDTTYRLILNMATDDWKNSFGTVVVSPGSLYTNNFVDSFSFVSYKQINITFTVPYSGSTDYQTLWVNLPAKSSSDVITWISNWNLNKVTLTKLTSGSGGGSTTPSGPSTSFDDTAIINSSKENTQDIINNNNTNTQDVINNANTNTQDVINNNNTNTQDVINNNNTNSQNIINNQNDNTNKINDTIDSGLNNKCLNLFDVTKVSSCQFANNSPDFGNCNSSVYDTSPSGGYVQYNTYDNWNGFHTDYIPVNQYTNYYLSFYNNENTDSSTNLVCTKINLYNSQKKFISQSQYCSGAFHVETSIETPYNASFVRISIESETPVEYATIASINFSTSQNYCVFGSTTSKLDDTNNYLKDDSDPTISNSALNDVFGKVHFTDPLSYLLTLPTQLINKIVSMSDTCSTIDLGTLYGVHLTLPCINLETYLGSDLWGIIDVILSVGLLSVILKNFYDTISNLLTLGGEKEAKEKFSMPTPMDFLAMILGGDNK